jgi:Tfp pilus assembly protein PilN
VTINLLSPPRRSLGALRRMASRVFAAMVATLFTSSALTVVLQGWTGDLRNHMSPSEGSDRVSLSSQLSQCNAERASLKSIAEDVRYSCASWRRPHSVLHALVKVLPNEMWLQEFSITGTEVKLVGMARSEGEIERLVSSPDLVNDLLRAKIVSTRTETLDGRRVFHLSAQAPPFPECGPREGVAHGSH